jgi:hypothetical protein
MHDHIATVVGRYKGKIKVWDVVNEAISDGGTNILRNSLWEQIIGPDFIAKAFEYAHEADPDAILRYNDYSLENPAKRHKLHWCHETERWGRVWRVFVGPGAALGRPSWLGFAAVSRVCKRAWRCDLLRISLLWRQVAKNYFNGHLTFTFAGHFRSAEPISSTPARGV